MILFHFESETGYRLGLKTPNGVIDLYRAEEVFFDYDVPTDLTSFLARYYEDRPILDEFVNGALMVAQKMAAIEDMEAPDWLLDEVNLRYGPAVLNPQKIICVGRNYAAHAAESGAKVTELPILFSKHNNALAAPGEIIPIPSAARQVDYEAELAVIIGKQAQSVRMEDALDYVFGYCNANDLTARDWQKRSSQWLLGKGIDKFCPLGPYIATREVVPDESRFEIRCWVNGELRQYGSTANMVFNIPYLISYISQVMTLEPGDVLLTGTPEGVIMGMDNPIWLQTGDVVEVEVGSGLLGRLVNPLA